MNYCWLGFLQRGEIGTKFILHRIKVREKATKNTLTPKSGERRCFIHIFLVYRKRNERYCDVTLRRPNKRKTFALHEDTLYKTCYKIISLVYCNAKFMLLITYTEKLFLYCMLMVTYKIALQNISLVTYII